MGNNGAFARVVRPFGASILAGRRWAKWADVAFAGVVVGAGGAIIGAAVAAHGGIQVALFAVGGTLVLAALVLATIAQFKGEPKPVDEKPVELKPGEQKSAEDKRAEQKREPTGLDDWTGEPGGKIRPWTASTPGSDQ